MKRLAPSILCADFSRLGEQVAAIEAGGADLIHVDVMDGHFVPNISFGATVMKSLVGKTALPFDVHLMIEEPDRYLKEFVTDQTEYVTVHAEACVHLDRTLKTIHDMGVKAGVALNPATSLRVLDWVLELADQVLIMSVNPGFGGQSLLPYTLEKVRETAALRGRPEFRNPELAIGLDGGVNLENLGRALEAGADILVAGNSVFKAADIPARCREFKARMI